jgi:hypothetical protein
VHALGQARRELCSGVVGLAVVEVRLDEDGEEDVNLGLDLWLPVDFGLEGSVFLADGGQQDLCGAVGGGVRSGDDAGNCVRRQSLADRGD